MIWQTPTDTTHRILAPPDGEPAANELLIAGWSETGNLIALKLLNAGFDEAPINFQPTYKYLIGCNEYDSEKRIPSYTDRILFKNKRLGHISCKFGTPSKSYLVNGIFSEF